MNEKLDQVLEKIGGMLDSWVDEFTNNPFRTTIKVFLILYLVKYAKKVLR